MYTGLVIQILLSFFTCILGSDLKCEAPWELVHRNCHLFIKEPLSWDKAESKCEENGGNLMSINSMREKRALQWALTKKIRKSSEMYWWVGLKLNRTASRWVWQDGSFLSLRSGPWAPGEPDNASGKEYCAAFHFTSKMYDYDCNDEKPFICQRIKLTTPPKTTSTTTFTTTSTTTTTTTTVATTEAATSAEQKRTTMEKLITKETTKESRLSTEQIINASNEPEKSPSTKKLFSTSTSQPYADKLSTGNFCEEKTVYGIKWPKTEKAPQVKRPCPNTAGFAFWACDHTGEWLNQPNMGMCSTSNIQNINKMLESVTSNKKATSEDMLSVAANLTESLVSIDDVSAADVSVSTNILRQVSRVKPKVAREAETVLKEVVKSGTFLFKKTESSKLISRNDKERATSDLLYVMEDTAHEMVDNLETTTVITTKTEKMSVYINVLNISTARKDLKYQSTEDGNNFIIPHEAVGRHKKDGIIKAVFMTHYDIGDILIPDTTDVEVASNVLTASLGQEITELESPVSFTIHLSKAFGDAAQPLCSFWNFSKGEYGQWSQDGCTFMDSNGTHVTCQCNHMTNFAILMDVSGVKLSHEHQTFLKYITYIGCIISITCLAMSWMTFQCCRSLTGERNSIHKNLVFCLFVAELIFVVGIERTSDRVSCAVIALLLHFFFLSSFMWMFLEGIHIVVLLQQVFETAKNYMKFYYLVGYGVPITVVAITAGIDFTAYGTKQHCWLTTENWFIWSFLGPVSLILIINTGVLMYALSMVCRHSAFIFTRDKSQHSNFRAWVQGAIALEVLLGSTWVFGYFFISESTVVMAYVFTVLNSIQGLFIFVFHCLLNKKIRFEYKKLALVRYNSQSSTKSASFKKKDGSYEVYVSG